MTMRGIELLHPKMRAKAEELQALCKSQDLPLLITETWRTMTEQDALYAQGRTTPGNIVTKCKGSDYQSPHQWGVAFDFCKNIKGQEWSDTAFFKQIGALGKSIGLFWGGDFKSFVDMPHLELPEFLPANSTATLKKQHGTPEKFKAAWDGGGASTTAAATPGNRTTVKLGSSGADVKILQSALTAAGYPLSADGSFGPKTDDAVKKFQTAQKLTIDGIVGPKTWAALEQYINPGPLAAKTPEEVTVDNAIADGAVTDREHWLGVLRGTAVPNKEYIKVVLDRYHDKLAGKK